MLKSLFGTTKKKNNDVGKFDGLGVKRWLKNFLHESFIRSSQKV